MLVGRRLLPQLLTMMLMLTAIGEVEMREEREAKALVWWVMLRVRWAGARYCKVKLHLLVANFIREQLYTLLRVLAAVQLYGRE